MDELLLLEVESKGLPSPESSAVGGLGIIETASPAELPVPQFPCNEA